MTDTGGPADCVFCGRIDRGEYAVSYQGAVAFEPLNPVTPGHLLVVPLYHVEDAFASPSITALTMEAAAFIGSARYDSCNVITSVGAAATQTVRHLHIHLVPRRDGDGLHLPWTGQQQRAAELPGGSVTVNMQGTLNDADLDRLIDRIARRLGRAS